jgi:protocatechuate 3,4-dioxygenase beta subunit
MKRRHIVLGGAAALGAPGAFAFFPTRVKAVAGRSFDWKGADFLAGGTKAVPASLPSPVFRATPNCVAMPCKTLGPCHMAGIDDRADISDGFPGLPARVSLRLVDAGTCAPIAGARVEIWHTNAGGFYTGEETARMCTRGDAEATAARAFRGVRETDADGQVHFLTVYPGWYPGRTVHIHLKATVDGQDLLVSQLLFDDALSDLIYADHPDYAGRGERDTQNGNDGIFAASEVSQFVFDVEKSEGVLLATYTIGVDRSGSC